MSRSLGYTKKFFVLKKDFSNMAGISPKGHGKIEIRGLKGSLSISLENAEDDQFYNVILVDGNHDYDLGKVYTEKNGKGRADLTFNISDLEASGFSIDKINGIIIKKEKDILLGGYLEKEDGSIKTYINSLMTIEPKKSEEAPVIEKVPEAEEKAEAIEEEIKEEPKILEIIDSKDEVDIEEPEIDIQENLPEEIVAAEEVEIEEIEVEEDIIEVEDDDLANVLEDIETDIVIEQIIEAEAEEDFVAEFEPLMEINQDPEPEAIEVDIVAVEPEDHEPLVMEIQEVVPEAEEVVEEIEVESTDEEEVKIEAVEELVSEDLEPEVEIEVVEEEPEAVEDLEYDAVAKDPGPEFEPLDSEKIDLEPEPVAIELEPVEYKVSKEEVVEIKKMDYEQNRRIIQRDQTTNYILNILKYFPYVDPFRINLHGYKWWRIDYQDEEKGFLPYFSYVIGGEKKYIKSYNISTSRDLMSSYAHYLFGLYYAGDEVKYYVYAVPGGFYKDEQPHAGTTGFNTWFPGSEISGYWLLYVDPLTGKVIYPINPMMPTE